MQRETPAGGCQPHTHQGGGGRTQPRQQTKKEPPPLKCEPLQGTQGQEKTNDQTQPRQQASPRKQPDSNGRRGGQNSTPEKQCGRREKQVRGQQHQSRACSQENHHQRSGPNRKTPKRREEEKTLTPKAAGRNGGKLHAPRPTAAEGMCGKNRTKPREGVGQSPNTAAATDRNPLRTNGQQDGEAATPRTAGTQGEAGPAKRGVVSPKNQ